jgi:hypothetical protein
MDGNANGYSDAHGDHYTDTDEYANKHADEDSNTYSDRDTWYGVPADNGGDLRDEAIGFAGHVRVSSERRYNVVRSIVRLPEWHLSAVVGCER